MINRKLNSMKMANPGVIISIIDFQKNNRPDLFQFQDDLFTLLFHENSTQPNLSLLISKLNNSQKLKKLNKTAGFRQHLIILIFLVFRKTKGVTYRFKLCTEDGMENVQ